MNNLGETLKEQRMALHLSQKSTCENICSQPMLSSIEKGKYIPNSQILILLCKRLKIDMELLSLNDNYQISSINSFNKKVDDLCNNHKYTELKKFLLADETVAKINTDQQTQAYYYYLSISYLQADKNLDSFESNLKLAISVHPHPIVLTTLDRLIRISMAVLYAKRKNNTKYLEYLTKSFEKFQVANFEANQIVIFYLAAYSNILLEKNIDALNWINQGIDFATKNNSHYMLANLYYLLAKIMTKENKSDLALDSINRSKIFTDLFNEKVFKLN
ncbi:helix-turn-helix domain-containing protein [Companilactobacillus keshanensis]|uniref:Helix-turn-helix domain-containing protein n=1 Tax=Companilactobacillus keshanensis TaxID=2486003 RepID=A0ABW4BSX1_9LACO|nr:helix-turn-helix transcriptional regulator [Companilactobacillus keshanensis]